MLTHHHLDHTGSAADLAAATGARVLAGALDAPYIRGTAPAPEPEFTPAERRLFEGVMAGLPAAGTPPPRPVEVDPRPRGGHRVPATLGRAGPGGGPARAGGAGCEECGYAAVHP